MKIGYLIPEFPGQTHVWMWREICHLREWGVEIHTISTRRPERRDRARHGFAAEAEAETSYLWPLSPLAALQSLLGTAARHPIGLVRCAGLALSLPIDKRPRWRRVLPLVLPACRLVREAERTGITRLHSHSCASSAILCMMAKRIAGLPFSLTLNANIEWWGGAMREKLKDAEFTIVIARWLLEQVRRDHPALGPGQVLLGRIGVDTRRWVPAERTAPDRPGPTRLLTVGRLHPSKGHDILLDAMKHIIDGGHDATLQVIGDGPIRSALEQRAAELGLSGRVTFLGSVGEDQIIEVMNSGDIFVLASHAEPLGVAYMEAMAMGLATIGTAAGGVGEIIRNGENGLLVPPRDPGALAGAIRRLIEDGPFRDRIGRAGRRTVVERFDSRRGAAVLYERIFSHPPIDVSPPDELFLALDCS